MSRARQHQLSDLETLPRPVYGAAETLPNRALAYRHSHPWVQLAYAAGGVLDVLTAAGRFVAPPQRAVWIPAGLVHRVRCSEDTEIRSLYIAATAVADGPQACRVLGVSPLLRELIRAFGDLPVEYDEDGAEGRLVRVLLDELAGAPDVGLMLPLPTDARLRQLCAGLEAQPDSQDSLRDWARRLGVSEKTLSRVFRRDTGLTFRLWRQRLRMLSAIPQLERGERVTDVGLACGYESTSAFIAAFREQFGLTPGEFSGARGGP